MEYTLENGISDAVNRANRERGASIAVYVDGADIVVQDAKAAAPRGARMECIAQFWMERADGTAEVQSRRAGASSEWRTVDP